MKFIITGSVAYDYIMRFPGYFREHILSDKLDSISLSFLVESMERRRGGIGPNIAYTLALLGVKSQLFATFGEDSADYQEWLTRVGVDLTLIRVIPEINTASFFVNTDRDQNQIASFYPGAMVYASELTFYDLDGNHPDLVTISPNDPAAMNRYVQECQELFIPYLYDPSQQIVRLEGEDLRQGVEGAQSLFVNDYEFSLIQKRTGMSLSDILVHVEYLVITFGEDGSRIYVGDKEYPIPSVPPENIADPTGVGDAYRGGFLAGFSKGWDLETCGMIGSLAATFCLEGKGPQSHRFSRAEFVARFRQHFDDDGLLEELL